MKKLLAILCFLPLPVMAQDAKQVDNINHTPYKNEIGISTGFAPLVFNGNSFLDVWATSRITYLYNFRKTQVGLIVEGGEMEWSEANFLVAAVVNQKIQLGKAYLYFGGSIGYYYSDDIFEEDMFFNIERGYSFGLQSGCALPMGTRFSFITEVGIRSTQVWFENFYPVTWSNYQGANEIEWIRYMETDFSISLPATMGIRYRF